MKKTFHYILIYLVATCFFFNILNTFSFLRYLVNFEIYPPTSISETLTLQKIENQNYQNESLIEKEIIISSSDTIYGILGEMNLSPSEITNLVNVSKDSYNLSRIQPYRKLQLTKNEKELLYLKYEIDDESYLEIKKSQDKYISERITLEYEKEFVVKEGIIIKNLFDIALSIGLPPRVVVELSNIFECEIDFNKEIVNGDSFKIVVEEFKHNDRLVKFGKILAAEFVNRNKKHKAYYFEDSNRIGGYYDENGQSLRKKFLRSPVEFSRISSTFTKKRFHPILKLYRSHRGIDYAAREGTPIRSVASGVVTYSGWKGSRGKFVKIRHDSIYGSSYSHLSNIKKGLHVGKKVKQGDVVGYVGKTGLATGPHCHFEFYKDQKFVNPLKLRLPVANPINKKYLASFHQKKEQLENFLSGKIKIAARFLTNSNQ